MTLFLQIGKERPSLCLGGESTAECTAGPAGGDWGWLHSGSLLYPKWSLHEICSLTKDALSSQTSEVKREPQGPMKVVCFNTAHMTRAQGLPEI